jgi:hypothetical protein
MADRISRGQALVFGGMAARGSVAGAQPASAARPAERGSAVQAGTGWFRLPVVTANIGRKHLGAREAAIQAVRGADPGHRPFVGWQEKRRRPRRPAGRVPRQAGVTRTDLTA